MQTDPIEERDNLLGALVEFLIAMRNRLLQKAEEGKTSWDDPKMNPQILEALIKDVGNEKLSTDSDLLTDVALRAMFLWWHKNANECN
ncbi:MAG: hypothetical protein OEQ39_23785 [Gammaproteobacteria bacterium]|nr:hypothetical protein [Gammaproteobacteria bacterium]